MSNDRRATDALFQAGLIADIGRNLATQALAYQPPRATELIEAQRLADLARFRDPLHDQNRAWVSDIAQEMLHLDLRNAAARSATGSVLDPGASLADIATRAIESLRGANMQELLTVQREAKVASPVNHWRDLEAVSTTNRDLQREFAALQISTLEAAGLAAEIAALTPAATNWAIERIITPDISSIVEMALKASSVVEAHRRFGDEQSHWQNDLALRMAAIHQPWAVSNALGLSSVAFGELAAFRDIIAFDEPFAAKTNTYVYDQLGAPTASEEGETPQQREARRDAAGRNSALVAFPGGSYSEVVVAAGFELLIPLAPAPTPDDGGEVVFDPQHNFIVNQLEQHVRQFMVRLLQGLAGATWLQQRVPGQVRLRWEERKARDQAKGQRVFALEQYADFSDFADIFGEKRNWAEVFEVVFHDKMAMQVSFRRLNPVRNHVMHSRPLGTSEVLDLVAESSRIFHAIGVKVLRG